MKPTNSELLARIDERTERLELDIIDIKKNICTNYVTKEKYEAEVPPIQDSINKVTWLVISSVILALMAVVIKSTDILQAIGS